MTFIYIFFGLLVAAGLFHWAVGVKQINALERGDYGPFTITRTSGSGDSYLAIDGTRRKLALINIAVPHFNSKNEEVGRNQMTIVFDYLDIEAVYIENNLESKVTVVIFNYNKPVPAWNVTKKLRYYSGPGVVKFFENYAPEICIQVRSI